MDRQMIFDLTRGKEEEGARQEHGHGAAAHHYSHFSLHSSKADLLQYSLVMDDTSPFAVEESLRALTDVLSPATRAERKGLLVSNVILALVVYGGMAPTQITALGIQNGKVNAQAVVYLVIGIVIYYMIAFVLYGWSDAG